MENENIEISQKNINDFCLKNFGISYEEYSNLDETEKRKVIDKYHDKNKTNKKDKVMVMIGEGEHTIFKAVKKGDYVWIGSGENFCRVRAEITPEESRKELDDKLDDILYSKPVAFVKKIQSKLKK